MSHLEFTHRFSQLESLLLGFAMRLTRDEHDARDLLQETAYKAFKHRGRYQPHTNLRAWLMTIMRNTFINDYRKRKRRQVLQDHSGTNYLLNSGGEVVRNEGESEVLVEELRRLIDGLEPWAREPFLLFLQGYKYEEIARELDIPLGTVKSRIFFARKCLKKGIKHKYAAEDLPGMLA